MNRRKIGIIITVILLFANATETKSQGYKDYKKIHKMYKNLHVADSLYDAKNYKSAIKFYKKSKDAYYYKDMMVSQIARCYYALDDTVKAQEYIKKIRKEKVEQNINEKLRAEFLTRKVNDQMYRSSSNDSLWIIQKEHDKDNQHFLDSIINEYGRFPSISMIGQDGSAAAFLFAQHADNDVEFQEKCLKFMKEALIKNDVFRHDFAYLMDRIMVNKHGNQLFGSQCTVVDGVLQSRPLYDEKIIKTLRNYFWMNPLEEYLEFMQGRQKKLDENKRTEQQDLDLKLNEE